MASAPPDSLNVDWREIAKLVLRDRAITSGLWKIGVVFNFAAVNAGPNEAEVLPTALVAIAGIALTHSAEKGPLVFDAAELAAEGRKRSATPIHKASPSSESSRAVGLKKARKGPK
jgi:hypothetical protein